MTTIFSLTRARPAALRLWHALNGLALLGLLGTVLLRKSFLSWRTNAPLIETTVQDLGGSISEEGAVAVAKALRDPMWEWHYVFGFALAALVALRLVVALVYAEENPARSTWRDVSKYLALPSPDKRANLHLLGIKLSYLAFYVVAIVMVGSGLTLYFEESLGIAEGLAETVKEVHEFLMWFFVIFASAHVMGVVIAELRGERGLASSMIHGEGDRPR